MTFKLMLVMFNCKTSKVLFLHHELVSLIQCQFKNSFTSRPIGTIIFGKLVYEVMNIKIRTDFSDQFRKVIIHFQRWLCFTS